MKPDGKILAAMVLALCAVGYAQTAPDAANDQDQAQNLDERLQYWFGVAVENIPPDIGVQLQLGVNEGLWVHGAVSGSPADVAHILSGDILLEVDGKKLTKQEDLAHAANAAVTPTGIRSCKFTVLHGGKRGVVEITPVRRPVEMQVVGGNLGNFVVGGDPNASTNSPGIHNYALPNGNTAQIGVGYQIDTHASGASATAKSIHSIVAAGQTVILTQDRDRSGYIRNTLAVNGISYPIEPGKVDALPESLRPLGQQLLDAANAKNGATRTVASAPSASADLEAQIRNLESQLHQLEAQKAALQK